tara:strand:- start:27 stop:458 length:432 start_codon:yes stop_codon:yes gene_type:complete
MTDAVVKGTYSDFKLIKTRNVVQMIIEVPIENAEQITTKFGMPQPHEEKWVAVALLNTEKKPIENSVSRAIQQAGILGQDIAFGTWLKNTRPELNVEPNNIASIQQAVRSICGVKSRSDFKTDETALKVWERLYNDYNKISAQ